MDTPMPAPTPAPAPTPMLAPTKNIFPKIIRCIQCGQAMIDKSNINLNLTPNHIKIISKL